MFVCSRFPIWCVVFGALVEVRKLFEIWIDSILLVFTHLSIPWHSTFNQLLKFSRYFVPSHYNCNMYYMCSQIHQFLLSTCSCVCILSMPSLLLAPNCHASVMLPLVLLLPILYFYYLHLSFLCLHYLHLSLLLATLLHYL